MRIVTFEPFLTELVCALGREGDLVGVSHRCDFPAAVGALPRVTGGPDSPRSGLSTLCRDPVRLDELVGLRPDLVLTTLQPSAAERSGAECSAADAGMAGAAVTEALRALGCPGVKVRGHDPRTLAGVFETFEKVGVELGLGAAGRDLAHRTRAQFMDWADNFYERTKNKRVTFLESVEPLRLGGFWIPDMIKFTSAVSQEPPRGEVGRTVEWDEIVRFNPDVHVIAPAGLSLNESAKLLRRFEARAGWESLGAVKRGEVIFAAGEGQFDRAGPRLREAMGVLVSAIAGLESGYITPRDVFYRLRWVELHRHRFT